MAMSDWSRSVMRILIRAALLALTAGGSVAFAQDGQDNAALERRVQSLEEQLVDMQVVVGTLESLAKTRSSATAFPVGGSSADAGRIAALERQIQSLEQKMQQLSQQVQQTGGVPMAQPTIQPSVPAKPTGAQSGGFDTTIVQSPEQDDAIGGLIESAPTAASPATGAATWSSDTGGIETDALAPPSMGDPKALYETAYGHLLQRNYGAAEVAFQDFLQKFPDEPLSSNAQYWLGETYFVRGQYKSAANAFLKGYKNYAQGSKAPDSLLKLAMSLERLGKKDAACTSFTELTTRFPNAPQNVIQRANSEIQRVGCSQS